MKFLVSLYSWENPRICAGESVLEKGDLVVVETELGPDLGKVEEIDLETKDEATSNVMRKATQRDVETFEKNLDKKEEILKISKEEARRLGTEMKFVDARITLDGGNIIIIFTADGRVDFRELVKNISKIFHRSVRMQQVGSRDEARRLGGCGVCGRELCCVKFAGSLPSISTEMARCQQIAHRGSERISGLCGRLMCCLAYEATQYQEMLKGMPELRSLVKIKEGKGEVIEINALTQEVKVRLADKIVTVKKEELQ